MGSSANKSFGLADKALAIATLCFCPPDKSFGNFLTIVDKWIKLIINQKIMLKTLKQSQ